MKPKTYAQQHTHRLGLLRLDMNENLWGPPPGVFEMLATVSVERICAYPEAERLITALSDFYDVPTDCILLSNGSNELLRAAFCAFGTPAALILPSFSMLSVWPEVFGIEVVSIDYEEDFGFPQGTFHDLLAGTHPRVAFIVSPNNPTGTQVNADYLDEVAQRFPETVFVVDEAYAEFAGQNLIPLAMRSVNIVVTRTFSKAWGLAGLRLGYAVGPVGLIERLQAQIGPFTVNALAMEAALVALQQKDWLERVMSDMRKEKERLVKGLQALGLDARGTVTNFVLVRLGKCADTITAALADRGILIRNISYAHRLLHGFVRITVGPSAATTLVLNVLTELLGGDRPCEGQR